MCFYIGKNALSAFASSMFAKSLCSSKWSCAFFVRSRSCALFILYREESSMMKKVISLLLTALMLISLVPVQVFAVEDEFTAETAEEIPSEDFQVKETAVLRTICATESICFMRRFRSWTQ